MTDEELFSLSDVARTTGKAGNRKLLRALLLLPPEIPHRQVGQTVILDALGRT